MKHISEAIVEGLQGIPPAAVTQPDPGAARTCPPCSGDCRQGRDCPAADESELEADDWWFVAGVIAAGVCAWGGIIALAVAGLRGCA